MQNQNSPLLYSATAPASSQRGIALIMGLIILLVLTIIGIAAIKGSTYQERMASGYLLQAQGFQTVESGIRVVMGQANRSAVDLSLSAGITNNTDIMTLATNPFTIKSTAASTPPATGPGIVRFVSSAVAADGSGFNGMVNFYYVGAIPGAKLLNNSMGSFTGQAFEINSVAIQPTTQARVNNIQGVWYLAPKS